MMNDVKLLPLPKTWRISQRGADFIEVHTAEQMEAYARACVEADRKAGPTGSAPCARHCESTAYEIEIRRLKSALEAAR